MINPPELCDFFIGLPKAKTLYYQLIKHMDRAFFVNIFATTCSLIL